MFVKRKRNILARKYRSDVNNVAFVCNKKLAGFTIGKLYKPFAYSFNADCYKDFCVFDDFGRAMFMEFNLVDNGTFNTTHTNRHDFELKIADTMEDVDRENEKYKEIISNGRKEERNCGAEATYILDDIE